MGLGFRNPNSCNFLASGSNCMDYQGPGPELVDVSDVRQGLQKYQKEDFEYV